MNHVKVEGHTDLVRDSGNSAIVSNNQDEYRQYMEQYHARKNQMERLNHLEEKVAAQDAKLDLILKLLQDK